MREFQRIIISRTDSIGDVILTLPVAGMLKNKFPGVEIIFLGRSYTKAVINACEHIDRFMNWDEISNMSDDDATEAFRAEKADMIIHVFPRKEIARLAKKAKIPIRLGTTNRLYHWGTCNKLVRLSRKRSELHEAQLNLKLIEGISGKGTIPLEQVCDLYGLNKTEALDNKFIQLIDKNRFNLILHPKSKGSAREWGLENFKKLIAILPDDQFKIFISGTAEEGTLLKETGIFESGKAINLTGQMSLAQLMSFIEACDGLVAASTGPLHIAAALGKTAIGIYPPIRPMHPGRWAPVGKQAKFAVIEKECSDCRNNGMCHCMQEISPEVIKNLIPYGHEQNNIPEI